MKIYNPVEKTVIRQGYGVANTSALVLPLYQSLGLLGHDGFDFSAVCQDSNVLHGGKCSPVYFNIDGYAIITYIQKDDANGWGINMLDQDGIHKHCWWHFDSINPNLKVGDRIESGDFIGISGRTGKATGPHVHYGLYEYGLEDNGYHGAINPEPFYIPIFILDEINNLKQKLTLLQQLVILWQSLKNIIKIK